MAEAICEKRTNEEVSGIDEIHKYADSKRFMNPKQKKIFLSPNPDVLW